MGNKHSFCQSCGMPMVAADDFGTEKDGTPNRDYCRNCYKDGEFTNTLLTMPGMKTMIRTEMGERHAAQGVIEKAISLVPGLKRWKKISEPYLL